LKSIVIGWTFAGKNVIIEAMDSIIQFRYKITLRFNLFYANIIRSIYGNSSGESTDMTGGVDKGTAWEFTFFAAEAIV
jgi:hypothetical protein